MMSLNQACQALDGTLSGEDNNFVSVSTDTRDLTPGSLYFALKGESFDGHDYLSQAQQAGAIAAVVNETQAANTSTVGFSLIEVKDTRKALGNLAYAWRQKFNGVVVGVTGSNGKTTVKEMIAAILARQGDVLATRGNFNNDIGLPLTLLRMNQTEKFAVIEMGANHQGEILELANITLPDIALITNAGSAHLEGFGSIRGVAEAKAEIYSGLKDNGTAIINADDDYADYWMSVCENRKKIRYSLDHAEAEIKGEWHAKDTGGILKIDFDGQQCEINLSLAGRHNAMNALAAAAVSITAGASLKDVKQALVEFKSVKGRLSIHKTDAGLCVIDDTYNANPTSLEAGLNVLNDLSGEHWLVLGDMGELGDSAERLHFDAGSKARASGVHRLLAIGENSVFAVEAFGDSAKHFVSHKDLIEYLEKNIHSGLNVLVKGSRYMKMEQIVDALTGDNSSCY